jgi:hypothetical protein
VKRPTDVEACRRPFQGISTDQRTVEIAQHHPPYLLRRDQLRRVKPRPNEVMHHRVDQAIPQGHEAKVFQRLQVHVAAGVAPENEDSQQGPKGRAKHIQQTDEGLKIGVISRKLKMQSFAMCSSGYAKADNRSRKNSNMAVSKTLA